MNFRNDVNKIMKNVQVDYEMTDKILNSTTRKNKACGFSGKRVVAVAMAAVLCLGTMVVGVSGVTGVWDDIVGKVKDGILEVGKQQQIKLVDNGYVYTANEDEVTASSKGISVSLIQTVADKKGIYVYLKIKSENIKLTENMQFWDIRIKLEGVGEIQKQMGMITPISDYEGIMEIYGGIDGYNDEGTLKFEGKKLEVILTDLEDLSTAKNVINENGYLEEKVDKLVESQWNLSWIGKANTDSKVIQVSETMDVNGNMTKINSLEITPLSVYFRFDYFELKEDNYFFEIPFAIIMKDGTKYKYEYDKTGVEDIFQGVTQTYIRITNPIEINDIDYIEVCGTRYDV